MLRTKLVKLVDHLNWFSEAQVNAKVREGAVKLNVKLKTCPSLVLYGGVLDHHSFAAEPVVAHGGGVLYFSCGRGAYGFSWLGQVGVTNDKQHVHITRSRARE